MAELPVQSMKEGGLWWFTDLTSADPYYILPLITAATLYVTIEIGTDSTKAQSMGMARYFLRALPVIIFPFTVNFPAVRNEFIHFYERFEFLGLRDPKKVGKPLS